MKVHFLGVGEACDPSCLNTALLISFDGSRDTVLLDCGFTTPHSYFDMCRDQDELAAVWISHFHGDHFFGVPLLLLRLSEMGRKRILTVIGPERVEQKIEKVMELAYPGIWARLGYEVKCVTCGPGGLEVIDGIRFFAEESVHSTNMKAAVLRLERDDFALFYSGDGVPARAAEKLAKGCQLIIHEAFRIKGTTPGHGSVAQAVRFAENSGCPHLALVHISRTDRQSLLAHEADILQFSQKVSVFLPQNGDSFHLTQN